MLSCVRSSRGIKCSSLVRLTGRPSMSVTGLYQPSLRGVRLLHGNGRLLQEKVRAAGPTEGALARRLGKLVKWSIYTTGVLVSSVGVSLIAFFLYDASTYKDSEVPDFIDVPKMALTPELGGPENLPILRDNLDAYDSEAKEKLSYLSLIHI